MSDREDYVRPVTTAHEPAGAAVGTWTVRLIGLVLLAALIYGVVLLVQQIAVVGG